MKNIMCIFVCFVMALTHKAGAEKLSDLEFAKPNNKSLKLDLYLPKKSATSTPLIIWIHGGGWQNGDKRNCLVKWMTAYGYAVASINYRLTDVAIFPAQIHDCKGAIRWLRAHAEKYNLDSKRFVVTGSSAGGHLAALVGTSGGDNYTEGTVGGNKEHSSKVQAIIDFYGASDFILRSKTQPSRANKKGSVVFKLLGGPASEKTDLARKASSAFYVSKDDPPLLILHGENDKTVLMDQSERLHNSYQSIGLNSRLLVIKGAGHGGKKFFADQYKKKMLSFLKKNIEKK